MKCLAGTLVCGLLILAGRAGAQPAQTAKTAADGRLHVGGPIPATAGSVPAVPFSSLKTYEQMIDTRFSDRPWDLVANARGSYLPGYGAFFTAELSLTYVMPPMPFRPTAGPKEVQTIHDQKMKQVDALRTALREVIVKSASSLTTLPPNEKIVIEIRLFEQAFENHDGLPWRFTMSATRQSLLDAAARRATDAEIASLIEERRE